MRVGDGHAMTAPTRVAAVQMVSGQSVPQNLLRMSALVAQAAQEGARVVLLPEYFCLMGADPRDKCRVAERAWPIGASAPEPGVSQPIQAALSEAARLSGVWLIGGTVPLASPDPSRVFNATLVFDAQGALVARYDKLHLFSFQHGQESYDESQTILAGAAPVACETPAGRTALSVCYDIRFPEFFRSLAQPEPLDLIVVPAAFTETTGRAHWELLLRARAVENQCWLLASAQGGLHENGRRTWGHSMLIDPWGEVVERLATGEGIVSGVVDPQRTAAIRLNLPALAHRRVGLTKED
ncbi:MAG: Nitrilase [Pseudomonadota bacterium]